jgi:glycosyltransferase involved in cell wall biosynthesis
MSSVSVILITKNQEWNIPRMVESVLREIAAMPESEIVLVDSASSDGTVAVAQQYPVGIVRLHPDQRLTAGMGRYAGYEATSGDFVLFLDGDMELGKGWLRRGLDVMEAHPEIAVTTGLVIDRPLSTPYEGVFVPPPAAQGEIALTPLPYSGGAALYRRSVLEEVGTFHPYVYSDEEPELCVRIRHRGYQIFQLNYPIAYHYSRPTEAISTLFARWRRNLYLGAGQNLRYHVGRDTFRPYVLLRGFGLIPAVALAAGVMSLMWYVRTRQWQGFAAWLSLIGIVLAADSYRKRSVYRALFSLTLRLLIMDGTIRGFFLPPLDVQHYPVRLEVVQRGKAFVSTDANR